MSLPVTIHFMSEVASDSAEPRAVRRLHAFVLPLATLSVFLVGLAALLSFSPLNEMPDTYCQTVLHPPSGSGCSDVLSRRWHWIAVVLGPAAVLAALAVFTRRRAGPLRMSGARAAAAALMLTAIALGLTAGSYLTVGKNHEMCGSTLSRVDEHGTYSPDRPLECAASYADSRFNAWTFGLLGLAVFLLASGIELDEEARAQRATRLPAL